MNHNIGISPLKFQVPLWCPVRDGFDQHIRVGFVLSSVDEHFGQGGNLDGGSSGARLHPASCQLRINSPGANPSCETSAKSVDKPKPRHERYEIGGA